MEKRTDVGSSSSLMAGSTHCFVLLGFGGNQTILHEGMKQMKEFQWRFLYNVYKRLKKKKSNPNVYAQLWWLGCDPGGHRVGSFRRAKPMVGLSK